MLLPPPRLYQRMWLVTKISTVLENRLYVLHMKCRLSGNSRKLHITTYKQLNIKMEV